MLSRSRDLETRLRQTAIWNTRPNFIFTCRLLPVLGSFSNDDGDGNQDVKKVIGLLRKTTTLHVYHAFFVHFFTVLARLRRENA